MYNLTMFSKRVYAGVLIITASAALVLFILANHSAPSPQDTVTMVLTDKGFMPNEVFVRKGGTVTFTSDTNKQFWPASNNHPSHTIYPQLDPKRPLQPGEHWTFTFDRVGDWGIHDHIRSYFSAVIHVTASP